jgi:hypothetical protein
MTRLRFTGALEAGPSGGAYVTLPADVLTALGGGSRLRVRGTFNGVEFHSNTIAMGGATCLGVHKATREAAGTAFGDEVPIEIEADDAPRPIQVPDELARAIASDPALQAAFDQLSPTRRREYANWVAEAKRDETRARRVTQTLERLRQS